MRRYLEQLVIHPSKTYAIIYMQIFNLKTLFTSLVFCFIMFCTMQVAAVTYQNDIYEVQRFDLSETFNRNGSLSETQFLAENKQESNSDIRSGDIVIPGASESQGKEKKCVTVCDEWGKDCIINPRTGQRKCRRMCKSFGEECL